MYQGTEKDSGSAESELWDIDAKRLQRQEPVVKAKKVYQNEPCPCGSGKKYKNTAAENSGGMRMKRKERTSCETCAFYVYDDDYGAYLCDMNMDEDDYVRIMSDKYYQCPYYRNGDEYAVVRKQI